MNRRVVILIGSLAALALAAPWIAPYDPESQHRNFLYAPPMKPRLVDNGAVRLPFVYPISLADRISQRYIEERDRTRPLPWFDDDPSAPIFLIGADSFGRDLLSRLLYGARVSITLALASVAGALVLGALIGVIAGYRGGWIDEFTMRVADFVIVLPAIYVVLVLRAVMPLVLSPTTVFVAMTAIFSLVGWPFVARGVRAIVAAERSREYIIAAQSLGATGWRIMGRHLLPACRGHLLVQATLLLPAFILAEATLSYIGLGFPDSVPTWGTMLGEASNLSTMSRFPWMLVPALAIFLVVLSANLILQSDKIERSGRSAGL